MRKLFIKTGTALIAALIALSSAVSAATIDCLTIDEGIIYSSPDIKQGDYAFSGTLASSSVTVSDDGNSFTLASPKYSFYKESLLAKTPGSFTAKGAQLCTVFETKFNVTLQDPSVTEDIPTFSYGLRVNNNFIGEGDSQKRSMAVDGTEYVIKYVINPVTQEVYEYRNDELITTTALSLLATSDITEIRFYPRPLPGRSGNECGYNNDADGVITLSTPILWNFDYMKIYQITPYEIESSDPADGGMNASTNGPYTVTFDSDMEQGTVNSSSVKLVNDADGSEVMVVPSMSDTKTCTIYPAGPMEYFTKYRLSFSPDVTDANGFSHEEDVTTSFTTEKRIIREAITYSDQSNPIILKCGGADMSVLTPGTITGEMKLKNTGSDTNVRIIAAVYEKSGDDYMLDTKTEKTVTIASGEATVELPSLTVTDSQNQFIKYMVWDETGYPLTDAVICDSEHIGI
jgi:hypothetical protein